MYANVYEKKDQYVVVFSNKREDDAEYCVYCPNRNYYNLLARRVVATILSDNYYWCCDCFGSEDTLDKNMKIKYYIEDDDNDD